MADAPIPLFPPRARIADIAAAAGVSTATVDRVLNGREGVRPMTARRVMQAAAQAGYAIDTQTPGTKPAKPLKIEFLVPAGTNRYLRMLGDYIEFAHNQWAAQGMRCRVHYVESFNPNELAARLLHYGQRADGVVFMALEHPVVRDAVNALADQNVPAITLISDLSNSRRLAYVGIDNRSAGRTAALLLGRFMGPRPAGKIAMLAGSLNYRGHEEREIGFLHLIESTFPQVKVIGLREGQDDSERNYVQTRNLIAQHPDLAGVYNSGGGSDGVARAIVEAKTEQKILFVGHGLTPDTRALLIDGTMDALITQTPQAMVGNCLKIFRNVHEARDALDGVKPVQFSIVLRENLP
ncbi:LacI family DNA-binding transcriptional regulator [Paraburkholderia sabiae]|uniref:LacI family DNA-binding transcriptional regulator n=1 Tax=Paraburkholderia sabiae TaxID=273251 RepID=A0ABU9Q447_9BURK|nr:LacI family DNA-binding transcriptional regulator [Paraburkholderia sabiae]WJZ71689.1 LacI family DNA-binding transcriptional regulator [Paraburkholderia sabiae]CAD6519429.1 HTH-type transcriptional repressor PurR [Paraburkholderia sabiae]